MLGELDGRHGALRSLGVSRSLLIAAIEKAKGDVTLAPMLIQSLDSLEEGTNQVRLAIVNHRKDVKA